MRVEGDMCMRVAVRAKGRNYKIVLRSAVMCGLQKVVPTKMPQTTQKAYGAKSLLICIMK